MRRPVEKPIATAFLYCSLGVFVALVAAPACAQTHDDHPPETVGAPSPIETEETEPDSEAAHDEAHARDEAHAHDEAHAEGEADAHDAGAEDDAADPEAAAPDTELLFHWDERWGRSGIPNYIMIGGAVAFAAVMLAIGAQGTDTPTRGGWLFDEEAHTALRLSAESDRLLARDISDVFLTLMTSAPALLDAFILASWQHGAADVGFELVLIHAEVAAVTAALQIGANVLVTRERPYGRTCGGGGPDDLPELSYWCNSPERNYSFFSGHTSQVFAAAAVVCSAHMNLPLLGGGDIELAPCIAGFTIAAATGMLRMLGDQHYVTDVVVGAAIGTLVGFVLPWALHYRHRRPEPPPTEADEADTDDIESVAVPPPTMMTLLPTTNGLAVYGVF